MSPIGRMTSYQGTRVPVLPAGEVVVEPPIEGSEVPTLPADSIVGTAAWRAMGWGHTGMVYRYPTEFATWRNSWGFGGFKGHLGGDPRIWGLGGPQDMLPTSVIAQTDSKYDWQKGYEGIPNSANNGNQPDRGLFEARKAGVDIEGYLGFYTRAGQSTRPPMGDWFDDNLWSVTIVPFFARAAAAMQNVLQGTGFTLDIEPQELYDYEYGGHTLADIRPKAEQRGYEIGSAIFQNMPGCVILFYGWRPPGCQWNNVVSGPTVLINPPQVHDMFARGFCRAMGDHGNANARCVNLDAQFYKFGAGGGGSSREAKLKMAIERIGAVMSTQLAQTVWNKACDRIQFTPFSWPGTDGDVNYPVTPAATYAAQIAIDRIWGMGGRRGEYLYGGEGTPPGFPYSPSYLAGMVAAANPAPIASSLPTISNLAWNGTTLTCRASHPYGVWHLKVYSGTGFNPLNPTPNYLGAMRMTWNGGGGTTSTNFNNSYQDCTFTTSGPVGDWRVVRLVSAKDDVRWARIQRTT